MTAIANNILQPQQNACGNAAGSPEFMNSLCEALLHTTNNDN